jgi:hypothetical protein
MAAESAIRIVPLHGVKAVAPVAAPSLTYRGGPLLAEAQVFVFFWGDAWAQDPLVGIVQQINSFFDYALTSPLIDQLAEYSVPGTAISHGARVGSIELTTAPPSNVSDGDIQQLIQQELSSDPAVPQPNSSSLYFVYLPPGVSVGLNGGASCVNFCGYHNDINGQIFYAVMPYPDCSGCVGGLSLTDAITSVSSHELCEAITDPIPGQGWYDDQNGEIGDICSWRTKQLSGFTVQLEWSNQAGSCI